MIGESTRVMRGRCCLVISMALGVAIAAWPTIGRPDDRSHRVQPGQSTALAPAAADSADDEMLRQQVQNALHDDRYFLDSHVSVSMEHGNVALRGFVLGEWDLRTALLIARRAANGRRVLDYLSIKLGGAR